MEHVSNNATSIGQRRGAKGASKESKNEKRPGILRSGAGRSKSSQRAVCADKEHLATKHLAQRSPQEGANGEPKHKERDAKRRNFGSNMKLLLHLKDPTGVSRGNKGYCKCCNGNNQCNPPFLHGAEIHRVARVIDNPCHDKGIFLCA